MKIGEDAVVMNANLSIAEGAVYASGWGMYGDAYEGDDVSSVTSNESDMEDDEEFDYSDFDLEEDI